MALPRPPDIGAIGLGLGVLGILDPAKWEEEVDKKPTAKFTPPSQMPPGRIYIYCNEPVAHVSGRVGPEPWLPTEGFGGWEVVDRPHQVGMVTRTTTPPYQYSGSIVFDHYRKRKSVEALCDALMLMAHGDDENEPGIISIVGIPHMPAEDWVIENLEFTDDMTIRRNSDFNRVRQKVILTIREYVPPTYMRQAKNATKKGKGNYTFIRTKAGDTPHKIALREKCSVTDLRKLNPELKLTKANMKLRTNTRMRVPVPDAKRHKDKKSKSKSRG
jgi:hypothetical protein